MGKHTVITSEIQAAKRAVDENRQVTETFRREEAKIDTDGDPNIVDEETDGQLH